MPNFGTRKRKVYHMCTTKWGEKTSISTHFSRLWYSFGTQIAIGGTPEAIHKNVKDLLDEDKTIYWERMAFCFEIP